MQQFPSPKLCLILLPIEVMLLSTSVTDIIDSLTFYWYVFNVFYINNVEIVNKLLVTCFADLVDQ